MTESHPLSVVVCSFNGAARLVPCFESLAHQRTPANVIVVDDGSTDETEALATNYGFDVVRHPTNRGISAARNTGLSHARSRLVAFCDEDGASCASDAQALNPVT